MSDPWTDFVRERGTADEWADHVNASATALEAGEDAVDVDFATVRHDRFFRGDEA